jgi:chaperonin GroES
MPRASSKDTDAKPRPAPARSAAASASSKGSAKKPRPKKAGAPELRLTGDRLIVRPPENGERKTAGGLLIPATAMPAPKRLSWGDVALVGPDVRTAKEGDRVLYLLSTGLEVELDGEEFVLLRERDVQAVSAASGPDAKDRAPGQYL